MMNNQSETKLWDRIKLIKNDRYGGITKSGNHFVGIDIVGVFNIEDEEADFKYDVLAEVHLVIEKTTRYFWLEVHGKHEKFDEGNHHIQNLILEAYNLLVIDSDLTPEEIEQNMERTKNQ